MADGIDGEDVARLRIALGRIARPLDRQSRGGELTRTQPSVLATVARLGPLRLSELAEIEGVNPTMLSRMVGKLEEAGLLHRPPSRTRRAARVDHTDGRRAAPAPAPERTQLFAERLAGLPGARAASCSPRCPRWRRWPTQLAEPAADRPVATAADGGELAGGDRHAAPADLRRTGQPQLPALVRRPGRLAGRHLDADGRAVLAGAAADRLGHRDRAGRRPADAAGAAARALRRRGRRPGGQAPADDRPAGDDGRAGAGRWAS